MENETINRTREALVNDVNALKRDTVQIANDVKLHANAHVDATKKQVNDTIAYVRGKAIENPFALLGIGFVIGWLLGRRRA